MTKEEQTARFAELFVGYEKAHGEHELAGKPDEHGKIKGRASTKGHGATAGNYTNHLNGTGVSLGLIPLLQDDTCRFGAIDVDINGEVKLKEKIEELEKRIRGFELPLVVCRSKSGGAHLYLLCKERINAKLVQTKLTEWAAMLGYGGAEIFPKQTTRVNEEDRGNWINICYYGVFSKESTRYCIKNGKPINDFEAFLKYAAMMSIKEDALREISIKKSDMFSDGPPCLQTLVTIGGFEAGGRNNSLTNIAVYYKKKNPDNWQEDVMKFNYENLKPSLDQAEVSQIIKNISRKDYFYTCKVPPICNHCDKKLCGKREFGLTVGGSEGELFPLDNITKCKSRSSVRWYAEYQGQRLELTTDELMNPYLLAKKFLEAFSIVVITGKQKNWLERLKELMASVDEIQDPDDASKQGQFENLLDNFFNASRPARNKDELLKGNSYVEDGRIIFRSEDLFQYLRIRRFNEPEHETWQWLKALGATNKQMKVKGKMLRVWTLPEPEKFENTAIDLPEGIEEEL